MDDERNRKRTGCFLLLVLVIGIASCLFLALFFYRPDRPRDPLAPASSSGPAFQVQVLRPRMGLPLGGVLPPQLFGVDEELEFDSNSKGARVHIVEPDRIELEAEGWSLRVVLDENGRIGPGTEVVFDLVFEDRLRRVRCRPADRPEGTVDIVKLAESGELAGSFHIELVDCEDAETGTPLGWPPEPLILHGSFDRLPLDGGTESYPFRTETIQSF